jgi:uncharacterized protein YbjT (DUF2867 family)
MGRNDVAGPTKLVIGASGFLGSRVTRQLVERGEIVSASIATVTAS